MTTVGIVGGTGPAGRGVAIRLATGGYDVVIGSRLAERGSEIAAQFSQTSGGHITGGTNTEAAGCDVVVIATPWESALATVKELAPLLANKVVVSMVNALTKVGKEMIPLYPPRGSMAAQMAHLLPQSKIVGAFHHLPAAQMENLNSGLEADVMIFGDHEDANDSVAKLVEAMPGLDAVVVGSMSLASAVEAFTAVCISVNIRHKAHSSVRLSGLH